MFQQNLTYMKTILLAAVSLLIIKPLYNQPLDTKTSSYDVGAIIITTDQDSLYVVNANDYCDVHGIALPLYVYVHSGGQVKQLTIWPGAIFDIADGVATLQGHFPISLTAHTTVMMEEVK